MISWSVPTEEHSVSIHKWQLLPYFKLIKGFLHRSIYFIISCYLVPGFTPSMARFVPNDIISDEVCRVFVLRCHSTSHLTCPVLFRQGHLLYIVIQSYSYTIMQVIHSCIHRFIRSSIHIIYTKSFMHDCISRCLKHATQRLVWLYPFSSVIISHVPSE